MKSSKGAAKILIILFGVIILILTGAVIKPKLDDKKFALEQENKKLAERLARLTELEANLATYQTQKEQFDNESVEILNQFPAELRTEDAILYAKKLENTSDMKIATIGVAPGSLLYALNGDNLDATGLATVSGSAADSGGETTGDTGDAAATGTADTTGTGTNAAAGTDTAGDDLGIIEESQVVKPDYNLYDMVVSYDFKTSYEDMKKIFQNILDDKNKRNIGEIAITYDEESGKLIGNMTVNMYFVTGTEKTYEAPDAGNMKHGLSNIFGSLKKSGNGKSGEKKSSGGKKKKG